MRDARYSAAYAIALCPAHVYAVFEVSHYSGDSDVQCNCHTEDAAYYWLGNYYMMKMLPPNILSCSSGMWWWEDSFVFVTDPTLCVVENERLFLCFHEIPSHSGTVPKKVSLVKLC